MDASAAKAVILTLSKKLQLDVDTTNLDKIITKTAKAIREIEKQQGIAPISQLQPGIDDKPGERPSYIR
jgi:proteasome assembly chaperone (PAC2) family protein